MEFLFSFILLSYRSKRDKEKEQGLAFPQKICKYIGVILSVLAAIAATTISLTISLKLNGNSETYWAADFTKSIAQDFFVAPIITTTVNFILTKCFILRKSNIRVHMFLAKCADENISYMMKLFFVRNKRVAFVATRHPNNLIVANKTLEETNNHAPVKQRPVPYYLRQKNLSNVSDLQHSRIDFIEKYPSSFRVNAEVNYREPAKGQFRHRKMGVRKASGPHKILEKVAQKFVGDFSIDLSPSGSKSPSTRGFLHKKSSSPVSNHHQKKKNLKHQSFSNAIYLHRKA